MNIEITTRTSSEEFDGVEDRIYKVDSSGAAISSGYSTSLLHEYCARLPHDEWDPTSISCLEFLNYSFCIDVQPNGN